LPGLGSVVVLLATLAVSVMVEPGATVLVTCTTNVKFAVEFAATLAFVHLYGAVLVHVHAPPGPVRETKVVFAGRVSVRVTVAAAAGPAFATV
jgi:hypothetical protein